MVAINLGASVFWAEAITPVAGGPCVLLAGIFLYFALRRLPLPPQPGPETTPQEKAHYNLYKVARLVGAEPSAIGGWQLRVGQRQFEVSSSFIRMVGVGQTCYQDPFSGAPTAEKIATALLILKHHPESWYFWRQNHGRAHTW